jgi:hypothetical protein
MDNAEPGVAMRMLREVLVLLAALLCSPVQASFHTFQLNEFYSNADGSIQYIELREAFGANGQQFLSGHTITSTQGGTTHTFVFPTDLPSAMTANQSVLIATPGFAALGIVTPDYIVPAGFLFGGGGTVDYAGVDIVTIGTLPTDGVTSLNRNGTTGVNSPRNFAGQTGSIPAVLTIGIRIGVRMRMVGVISSAVPTITTTTMIANIRRVLFPMKGLSKSTI